MSKRSKDNFVLKVEAREGVVLRNDDIVLPGVTIIMTPPLNEDFWLLRVPVSDKQAVVAFPKFGMIGIGFQKEEDDWNTNLPSSCAATKIFDHIRCNKGDDSIPDARCVKAIKLLKQAVEAMSKG